MRRSLVLVSFVLSACASSSAPETGIVLEPCDDRFGPSALCGWAHVAEDRANDDSRMIDVRVVVLPAKAQPSLEPVLLFPGGPGQATTDLIGLLGAYPAIQDTRDVVFVGQRGTGESNALHCAEDIAADPGRAFGELFNAERVQSCFDDALTHADPSFYTTEEYVADIAEVLDGLDHTRAVLWGGSGGTRTALAFIRAHEERVVAAVLDGVAPLDYGMPAPFSAYAQTAWDRVVADCSDQADCAAAYPGLEEDFDGIVNRLRAEPTKASVRKADGTTVEVEYGIGDFVYGVRGILYNAGQTARLPRQIAAAASSGDFDSLAQALYERSVAIRSNVMAMGLHWTIYCAEDVPLIDVDEAREAVAGTFIDLYLVGQYSAACEAWRVDSKPADWYRPVEADVPVLLLSGYYDPTTPAQPADYVGATLANSRHIVVRNVGHGAGFGCARTTVERFLVEGSFEGFENPCPDTPIRFEAP